MNDVDELQDQLIRGLAPTFRTPRAPDDVLDAMVDAIVRSSTPDKRRIPWFKRPFALAPAVGAVAALAVVLVAVLVAVLPAATPARALEIVQRDGYLEVRILDPVADPQRYRDEFARHGLDIELTLAAADAEHVGRVIFQETGTPGIEVIEAPGDCTANGNCSVGLRVPVSYASYARIVFGRTPRPGESVDGDTPVLSPGEDAMLESLRGKRVAEMRAILAAQGWTPDYRVSPGSRKAEASEIPDEWFVNDVAPIGGKVAVVWVDPVAGGSGPRPAASGWSPS